MPCSTPAAGATVAKPGCCRAQPRLLHASRAACFSSRGVRQGGAMPLACMGVRKGVRKGVPPAAGALPPIGGGAHPRQFDIHIFHIKYLTLGHAPRQPAILLRAVSCLLESHPERTPMKYVDRQAGATFPCILLHFAATSTRVAPQGRRRLCCSGWCAEGRGVLVPP
jgi:hypothetical protein